MHFWGTDLSCMRGGRAVFDRLSVTLAPGDILTLTGRNGSGKTSLLRLMAGLSPPAAGAFSWQDGPVTEDPERHYSRIAYIGHADALKPVLTAEENLRHWAAMREPAISVERISSALATFGLAPLTDTPARYLSAGQRRRLALARLLTVDAPLWLLDEPTIALDADSRGVLYDVLKQHRDAGGMAAIATNVALEIEATRTLDMAAFAAEPAA